MCFLVSTIKARPDLNTHRQHKTACDHLKLLLSVLKKGIPLLQPMCADVILARVDDRRINATAARMHVPNLQDLSPLSDAQETTHSGIRSGGLAWNQYLPYVLPYSIITSLNVSGVAEEHFFKTRHFAGVASLRV
ncbi:hypothetical protein QQF64_000704 [Cirrhinus molitorella]|uniref:Uncharacterized protein n=1 Tax=Cirrhinus molitorella TaxID=172907 RepID=A0ABR3NZD9_9TELE